MFTIECLSFACSLVKKKKRIRYDEEVKKVRKKKVASENSLESSMSAFQIP